MAAAATLVVFAVPAASTTSIRAGGEGLAARAARAPVPATAAMPAGGQRQESTFPQDVPASSHRDLVEPVEGGFEPLPHSPSFGAPQFIGDNPDTPTSPALRPFQADPLGFVAHYNLQHLPPKWKVVSCDAGRGGHDVSKTVNAWQPKVDEWFGWMSEGRYRPVLEAGGSVTATAADRCQIEAAKLLTNEEKTAGVAVITITQLGGTRGYGSAKGFRIKGAGENATAELNPRQLAYARMEGSRMDAPAAYRVLIHEMGHVLGWQHLGFAHSDHNYGFPGDVMSQGFGPTHAFNRYRTGWINPDQVVFHTSTNQTVNLVAPGRGGAQMLILADPQAPGKLYAVGVNPGQVFSPVAGIQSEAGVDVIVVDQTLSSKHAETYKTHCPSIKARVSGMCARFGAYTGVVAPTHTPDHTRYTLKPGMGIKVGGVQITVTNQTADGYQVRLAGRPHKMWGRGYELPIPAGQFIDVPKQHLFHTEINTMYNLEITRGCNPPANDRFCPDEVVTRGQMAAFLVRALGVGGGTKTFTDTQGHLFRAEIAALEAAGITRGCNPPANDRFCPNEAVTRGQMAAFLGRALKLPAGAKLFTDTRGHLFRTDIAALEAAGITRGCNPPANDRFCPDDPVTRGQMAAFLVRALSWQR